MQNKILLMAGALALAIPGDDMIVIEPDEIRRELRKRRRNTAAVPAPIPDSPSRQVRRALERAEQKALAR